MYKLDQRVFCFNYNSLRVNTGYITHITKKYYHVRLKYDTIRCLEDELLPIETQHVVIAKVDGLRNYETPKYSLITDASHNSHITEEIADTWYSPRQYVVDLRKNKSLNCSIRKLNGETTRLILWRGNQILHKFNITYHGSVLSGTGNYYYYSSHLKPIVNEYSRSASVFNYSTLNKFKSSISTLKNVTTEQAAPSAAILLAGLVSSYIFE